MLTILIVDVNELMRAYSADALTISNYDIYAASSGKEALSIHDQLKVDLIITDMIIPNMEGTGLMLLKDIESFFPALSG